MGEFELTTILGFSVPWVIGHRNAYHMAIK